MVKLAKRAAPEDEHDALEAAFRHARGSPMKVARRVARRVPLASMLNAVVSRLSPEKPARRSLAAPTLASSAKTSSSSLSSMPHAPTTAKLVPDSIPSHRPLSREGSKSSTSLVSGSSKPGTSTNASGSSKQLSTSGGVQIPPAMARHVRDLYARYVRTQKKEQLESDVTPLSTSSIALRENEEAPHLYAPEPMRLKAPQFVKVLRAHYPAASEPMLRTIMSELIEPMAQSREQRKWIMSVKAAHGHRLLAAFQAVDSDGSGGLDGDEFLAALQDVRDAADELPVGSARAVASAAAAMSAAALCEEEVRTMFADADADGSGTLDVDEFLVLCASQPTIVAAFDAIVEVGLRRAAQREEMNQRSIFRMPLSPRSRCIKSPKGHTRTRPNLLHLRPIDELVVQHATTSVDP